MRILLVAAVALVDPDGRVLIAKRPEGKTLAGLWEFPGGKVEPHERPEAALIRELKEELAIDVTEILPGSADLRQPCLRRISSAHAALCVPAVEGRGDFARRAGAAMGETVEAPRLSHAASRQAAHRASHRLALTPDSHRLSVSREWPFKSFSSASSQEPSGHRQRNFAEPGFKGFCWLSWGDQAVAQATSMVARMRPSSSENFC